jgi:acyl carrier protein
MSHYLEELKQLISTELNIPTSTLDAHQSLENFGIDSLTLAELLFKIEEHFSIIFPNFQEDDLSSLSKLAHIIEQTVMKKAA